jgi:hypothetical protein
LAPIGEHFRLVRFFKSENPQNVMVVFARLKSDCSFQFKKGNPDLGFYWLMDGTRYKPVHRLIQNSIRKRAIFKRLPEDPAMSHAFMIAVKPDKRLGAEVSGAYLKVQSKREDKTCKVETFFPAPAGGSEPFFAVESFFGESRKTFAPPFRKLTALTVRGFQGDQKTPMHRRFQINK